MQTRTASRRFAFGLTAAVASFCTLILDVAPYAEQALDMLQIAKREHDKHERRDESAGAPPRPPASPTDARIIEVTMQRYDVATLDMSRFHAGKTHVPDDGAILQHAFEIGLGSIGRGQLGSSVASRFLLDEGGPATKSIAMVCASPKQIALLEVLRHELTAPGETLVSFDEAFRVTLRRGLAHIRQFGMPELGHGMIAVPDLMHVPAPLPHFG